MENLEQAGASSPNILDNMGVMLVFALMIMIAILLLGIFQFFIYSNYKVFKAFQNVKRKVFWNTMIRYSLQSYLKTLMAAGASLSILSFASAKLSVSAILNLMITAFLTVLPVLYFIVLKKN